MKKKVAAVCNYIEDKIKTGSWKKELLFLTLESLATETGVSVTTAWAAVQELKRRGILDKNAMAKRTFENAPYSTSTITTNTKAPGKDLVQSLSQQIANDIIEDKFDTSDILPSFKELAYRYGTSFRTLKKTLEILVAEKRIVRHKRGFRIEHQRISAASATLIMVQSSDILVHMEESYYRTLVYVFLHHLEKECWRRKLRLVQAAYSDRFQTMEQFTHARGFIIWADQYLVTHLKEVLLTLLRFNKPVSIFIYVDLPPDLPKSKNFHFFFVSNYLAGFQTGKFILENGHRKACYLSLTHLDWANQRYQGIMDAWTKVGFNPNDIVPFFWSDFKNGTSDTKDRQTIHSLEKSKLEGTTLLKFLKQLNATNINTISKNQLIQKVSSMVHTLEQQISIVPFFKQAITIADATIWIVADDYLAESAMNFSFSQRIRIPRDISIISYNNTFEAYYYNISSYDFNMPAFAGRMIDAIVSPRHAKKMIVENSVESGIEGFIAVRGSTMTIP